LKKSKKRLVGCHALIGQVRDRAPERFLGLFQKRTLPAEFPA
jgi:hypothetical protein